MPSRRRHCALAHGDLLTAAEAAGLDVFVTTDKNLRYQQHLSKWRIAVVVLGHAQWPGLEPHASLVVAAIDRATPGGSEEVLAKSGQNSSVVP